MKNNRDRIIEALDASLEGSLCQMEIHSLAAKNGLNIPLNDNNVLIIDSSGFDITTIVRKLGK